MQSVFLSAFGVGGATILGVILGFSLKTVSTKFNDVTLSAAAGVMLASSVVGLLLPSLDYGGSFGLPIMLGGVLFGVLSLRLFERFTPRLYKFAGVQPDAHGERLLQTDQVLLFVTVIAVHNLPEGLAAGVGFGTEQTARAIAVAIGIALQNLPEGMVTVTPMLAAGIPPFRTLLFGVFTGVIEIIGTFLGFFAVSVFSPMLPFALAYAGGCMLYVICHEMIPETHAHGNARAATYALLIGFCVMLAMDHLLC